MVQYFAISSYEAMLKASCQHIDSKISAYMIPDLHDNLPLRAITTDYSFLTNWLHEFTIHQGASSWSVSGDQVCKQAVLYKQNSRKLWRFAVDSVELIVLQFARHQSSCLYSLKHRTLDGHPESYFEGIYQGFSSFCINDVTFMYTTICILFVVWHLN